MKTELRAGDVFGLMVLGAGIMLLLMVIVDAWIRPKMVPDSATIMVQGYDVIVHTKSEEEAQKVANFLRMEKVR